MGRVGYDSLEGILRLSTAGEAQPDPFVVEVLTYHAALELEMDEMLARSLPRAEKLRSGGLGFQQKISVLNAAWQGDPESGDNLAKALVRFNDLRNSVAHGDSKKEVAASHKNLIKAVAQIDPNQREAPSPYELAISICGFMGDDPGGAAALRQMRQIDDLVNELLPELFRRPVKDASA